jgi:PKD repeat protein
MRSRATSIGHRFGATRVLILTAAASAVLAVASGEAQAVIEEPIPADVGPTPPPIPTLHPAGETAPPADAISDPITPDATCGDWHLQGDYGGRWPTDAAWWEFQCSFEDPHCTGACNANTTADLWVDHFYWDGSQPVFYGEFYGAYYWSSYVGVDEVSEYWWDEPTGRWYQLPPPPDEPANATPTASFTVACSGSSCSFDGRPSSDSDGTIEDYSWVFGDGTSASGATTEHAYAEPGSYTATLTVTDDRGGWARDSKLVTIEASPPPPPNAAPTASFASSCSGLSCSFDASSSSDSDGTIDSYGWNFGDGTSGGGKSAQHTYAGPGSYTVKLTVTDDGGATATDAKPVTITVISLTARAYKVKGLQKADLSWSGSGAASFDVYRDGLPLPASPVQGTSYTDNIDRKGSGSYRYRVCDAGGTSTCSDQVTVTF